MRAQGESSDKYLPVMVCLDFDAEFPSVLHAWLHAVLDNLELSPELQRLIKSSYTGMHQWTRFFSEPRFASCAETGVAQGCPLSGTIFVFATEPVNRGLAAALGDGGEAGQFADDCAVVAAHPKELAGAARWLVASGRMSAFRSGLAKCEFVPLIPRRTGAECTKLADEHRRELTAHIPE